MQSAEVLQCHYILRLQKASNIMHWSKLLIELVDSALSYIADLPLVFCLSFLFLFFVCVDEGDDISIRKLTIFEMFRLFKK